MVELVRHVTMRSVQVAAVVAVPAAVVGARLWRVPFAGALMRSLRNATAAGLVVGPAMTVGKMSQEGFDDDAIEDRAFRIAKNGSQPAWDRACLLTTASVAVPLYVLTGTALGTVGAGFALATLGLGVESLGGPSVESLAMAPWELAYTMVVVPSKVLSWAPRTQEGDEDAGGPGGESAAGGAAAAAAGAEERESR